MNKNKEQDWNQFFRSLRNLGFEPTKIKYEETPEIIDKIKDCLRDLHFNKTIPDYLLIGYKDYRTITDWCMNQSYNFNGFDTLFGIKVIESNTINEGEYFFVRKLNPPEISL